MEKSMVHELNRLSSSQFIGNRSTFITTTLNDGDYELRKSRIQNLPSYRKDPLGDRLPFVIVFQTIEIERLSNEIEVLRAALKEAELQAFNVGNYEVQIRELTESCYSYELERKQYREEIDKLHLICESLYGELEGLKGRYANIDPTIQDKYQLEKDRNRQLEDEVEKWRARLNAMEISKNREMEEIRLMLESQRKSMLDREIKELTIKFNSERQLLENEIRKLRENTDGKEQEVRRLNSHISRLEIMNQEMRHYEDTIEQYENKFAMISQETIRLNDLLRKKQEEIEKLNSNDQKSSRRMRELEGLLHDAENKSKIIVKYETEINDWKSKYNGLAHENQKYEREMDKIPKYEQMVNKLEREMEDLKNAQKRKLMEVDDWKTKCYKLEENERQREAEKNKKIPAYENQIQNLESENDRLNKILKGRAGEIDTWKNKAYDLEKTINNYIVIEKEKKNLETELSKQIRAIDELRSNIKYFEQKTKMMDNLQRELATQEQQKAHFGQQIERLNSAVRKLNEERENYKQKCENLEKNLYAFQHIQEELNSHKQKEINFTKEIDRINGILNEKLKEIQQLKEMFFKTERNMEKYRDLEKKLIENVSQTQKLIHELDESRKEAGFFQEKFMSAEAENKALKNEIYAVSQEKDNMIRLINRKTQELEGALSENQEIKSQLQQTKKFESLFKQVQEKYKAMEQRSAEQERRLSMEQSKNMELNNTLEKSMSELSKLKRQGIFSPQFKEEFFNMKTQCERQERDYRNLQEKYFTIESLLRKMKSSISQNEQMNKRNNQKWLNVGKQIEIASNGMKKVFEMQTEINRLKEENMNLESRIRMLSFEAQANNMNKSFASTSYQRESQAQNSFGTVPYRKVESTFYLDTSESKSPKMERSILEPLYFKQNRQPYQWDLG